MALISILSVEPRIRKLDLQDNRLTDKVLSISNQDLLCIYILTTLHDVESYIVAEAVKGTNDDYPSSCYRKPL